MKWRRSDIARVTSGAVLGAVALTAVHVALRGTYWNSEEGVYALTARLLVQGHELYQQTVAAQPPIVFLVGGGLLSIHDGLEWLRLGIAILQLVAGLCAGQIVWRISGSTFAAVLTPAAVLLTPWAVHEHGSLTPEMVSLPFLLGGLLFARRHRTVPAAGVLCGLLPLVKVPDLLPALVIVLLSIEFRRTAAWAIATVVLGLIGSLALGGDAFIRQVFIAQTQSGYHSLSELKGWWAQAAWTLSGLLIGCLLAVAFKARAKDRDQLRLTLVTGIAMLVTLLSTLKDGTGLNVTVPIEAVLVPSAMSGFALAWQAALERRRVAAWLAAAIGTAAAIFTLAQSVSLMTSPTDPEPFLRAGSSRVGWAVGLTRPQLRAAVRAAQRCPAASFFGGPPLIAFVADREVPDDQPDGFITGTTELRAVRARMLASGPVCGS